MVIGWSGLPEIDISCSSALPMDVTRNPSCANLPCTAGTAGTVVIGPTHEPATVLSTSKAFCVSVGAPVAVGMVCSPDWGNAALDRVNRPNISTKGFICVLLGRSMCAVQLISSCVIVKYNTITDVKPLRL